MRCCPGRRLHSPSRPGGPLLARAVRRDAAPRTGRHRSTGRSDHPNQVNNVLGFPSIFRGALDVGAKKITENMKIAAAKALAALAKEPVPYYVKAAYNNPDLEFGKNHIIPTPFSKEVMVWVASAVAKAAFEDGVTDLKTCDIENYRKKLREIAYLDSQEDTRQ